MGLNRTDGEYKVGRFSHHSEKMDGSKTAINRRSRAYLALGAGVAADAHAGRPATARSVLPASVKTADLKPTCETPPL